MPTKIDASRFSGPEQFSQNFCWRAVDFARQKTGQNLGKSQNFDFFIHHKPAKISQNLDFFIPKQKTKIQQNRKISTFSSPQNNENPGKSQNLRFFCPPASERLRRSKQLKIKENREKPDFFVPTLPKRAGVHERARPLEPPVGGEAAERAEWTPLGGQKPAGRRPAGPLGEPAKTSNFVKSR